MFDDEFTWIAYRGGGGERPENTQCAFEHALGLSDRIVLDLDVRLTRDDALVVIHDAALERTTDGTGLAAERTLAEIERLDAGFRFAGDDGDFPFRWRGVRVPTLDSLLHRFPRARFNVDLREDDPRYPARVVNTIEDHAASERVIVVSEHDRMVAECRRLRPRWRYGAPSGEVRKLVLASKVRLQRLVATRADVFMIPEAHGQMRVLDERILKELHRRGIKVWIWTINQLADARRLRAMGVDGIFTEFPRKVIECC